jgi:hypothetical protein
MRKNILSLLLMLAVAALPSLGHAQASFASTAQITCAASGSSTQVLAAAASRESYLISNTSGVTVRVGALTGSSTANLTTSNSIQLLAGQSMSDSAPGIYFGRLVCMSTDGSTRAIEVVETRRP